MIIETTKNRMVSKERFNIHSLNHDTTLQISETSKGIEILIIKGKIKKYNKGKRNMKRG